MPYGYLNGLEVLMDGLMDMYLLFINSPDVFAKHVSLVEFVEVLRINAFYLMPILYP